MKRRGPLGTIALYSLLIFWAFICLFPFYWMITTSFKRPLDVNRVPRYIPYVDFQPIPDHWHFLLVTQSEQTWRQFRNSVIAATGSMVIVVIIGSMAGYALSRFKYYWARLGWRNDNIAFWIISQRFLPPAVLVIPFLIFYNTFNLIDTQFRADSGVYGFQSPVRGLDHARFLQWPAN